MARIAALDLGSNSFHLLVADTRPRHRIRRVSAKKSMVRLGEPVSRTGELGAEAYERGMAAIKDLVKSAKQEGATQIYVVATEALRVARDGAAFQQEVLDTFGITIQQIKGEQEAELSLQGMLSALNIPDGEQVLGLDLGGGSFELALGTRAGMDVGISLPLGGGRLMDFLSDPPKLSEEVILYNHCMNTINGQVDKLQAAIANPAIPLQIIGTAGTIRSLGRMAMKIQSGVDIPAVRGVYVTRLQLERAHHYLSSVDVHERMDMDAVSAQRADLLPGCGVAVLAVMEAFGLHGITLCDWGLREGVLLDYVDEQRVTSPDFMSDIA